MRTTPPRFIRIVRCSTELKTQTATHFSQPLVTNDLHVAVGLQFKVSEGEVFLLAPPVVFGVFDPIDVIYRRGRLIGIEDRLWRVMLRFD